MNTDPLAVLAGCIVALAGALLWVVCLLRALAAEVVHVRRELATNEARLREVGERLVRLEADAGLNDTWIGRWKNGG